MAKDVARAAEVLAKIKEERKSPNLQSTPPSAQRSSRGRRSPTIYGASVAPLAESARNRRSVYIFELPENDSGEPDMLGLPVGQHVMLSRHFQGQAVCQCPPAPRPEHNAPKTSCKHTSRTSRLSRFCPKLCNSPQCLRTLLFTFIIACTTTYPRRQCCTHPTQSAPVHRAALPTRAQKRRQSKEEQKGKGTLSHRLPSVCSSSLLRPVMAPDDEDSGTSEQPTARGHHKLVPVYVEECTLL